MDGDVKCVLKILRFGSVKKLEKHKHKKVCRIAGHVSYLHKFRNFPTTFAPLCPPNYLIVDEIFAHYPAEKRVSGNAVLITTFMIILQSFMIHALIHERGPLKNT